jgi:hypothetical protein
VSLNHPGSCSMASALARAKPSASTKASSQHLTRPRWATCLRPVATCPSQSKRALKRGLSRATARVVLVAKCWHRLVVRAPSLRRTRKPSLRADYTRASLAARLADKPARAGASGRAALRGRAGARNLSLCMSILAICSAGCDRCFYRHSATSSLIFLRDRKKPTNKG